jgi:hypothetical protein
MMRAIKFAVAAVIVSVAHAAPAWAEDRDSIGFNISLTVPEICQIETASVLIDQPTGAAVSSVFEMCNTSRGFRVMASHRTLASGEQVQINYAGQLAELDASGISDVAARDGPVVGAVPIMVQASGLTQGIAISLGIIAI